MSTALPPTRLAADFPAASLDQWRALVDKALKGADFDKRLVARAPDGTRIKPLYTRADERAEVCPPGSAPFTRGTHASVGGFGWDIVALIDGHDLAPANHAILADLEGGANGILLQCEAPGQTGVRVTSSCDVSMLLAGMHLDLAPLTMKAGLLGPAVARHLLQALPTLQGKPGKRRLSLGLDPLGCIARFGTVGQTLASALTEMTTVANEARAVEPATRTALVDATVYHEAGASEAQEIALLAATLVGYLRAFEADGVAPADSLHQIAVHLAVDTDIFLSTAKLRAARTIIARIAGACGADQAAALVPITAITSARMMARRDPWTNMLRTTAATVAGAFGGADAIVVLPYTHALGQSDAFARRMARNTQIIAQEESHLGRVLDPTGGSWYVEQLTAELSAGAWALFQQIEGQGGLAASLTSGWVQDQIATVDAERARAIATGRMELTGVSAFPKLGPDGVTVTPRPAAPVIGHPLDIRPLTPTRLGAAFERLRDAADAASHPPTVFLASLGEIADHTARSTWLKNVLASGGIASLASDGYASPQHAAEAFQLSRARVAVIASSDAIYVAHAVETARALKAAGATHIAVAGRPGSLESELAAAGVDRFIFAGQDAVATLTQLHQIIAAA